MTPAVTAPETPPTLRERITGMSTSMRWFLAVVMLPTIIVGSYLYMFAADQYESEAHFIVKGQNSTQGSGSAIGALLGMGSMGSGRSDSAAVSDYLTSHDVVDSLREKDQLVERFRRPEADALSRLPYENPTPESLLRYYLKQVEMTFDGDSGITTLKVRAFRPSDAYDLSRRLLTLGEQRVNTMNERTYSDAITQTRRQLGEAERDLTDVQARMTAFRQTGRDIDPQGTAAGQTSLIFKLQADLAAAETQLSTTQRMIGTNNPQYRALVQQVRSLQAQVSSQSGVLTGGGQAIAANLSGYERLRMEQGLIGKRYDATAVALEQARQQALRQQLYIIRVVNPNMPEKSLYPKRALTVITLFVVLLVAYGIGWLIAAGVREHAS